MDAERAKRPSLAGYAAAYVALLALSALTFGLSFLELGAWEWLVALGIALTKAVIVALFFMHLVSAAPSYRLAAVIALLLLSTMIALTAADVRTRRFDGVVPVQAREFERESAE